MEGRDITIGQYGVGVGWNSIVEDAIDRLNPFNVEITCIKEKFGSLRIYTSRMPEPVLDILGKASDLSIETCEECGKPGKRRASGWIKTFCDDHSSDPILLTWAVVNRKTDKLEERFESREDISEEYWDESMFYTFRTF